MKKSKIVQYISRGGTLTSLTVLLQSAPIFLPAVGLIMSPFSTLPIAIAAVCNVGFSISVFIASTLLLAVVSPQEALIFFFTTGLLGIVLGSMLFRKESILTILVSAISLSIGMFVLTYIIAIPGLKDLTRSFSLSYVLILYITFSIIYSSIWRYFVYKFTKHLIKIRLIEKPKNSVIKSKS